MNSKRCLPSQSLNKNNASPQAFPTKKLIFFFNEQLSVKSKFEVPYRWKPGADNNINIWL